MSFNNYHLNRHDRGHGKDGYRLRKENHKAMVHPNQSVIENFLQYNRIPNVQHHIPPQLRTRIRKKYEIPLKRKICMGGNGTRYQKPNLKMQDMLVKR